MNCLTPRSTLLTVLAILFLALASPAKAQLRLGGVWERVAVVREAFLTARDTLLDIDSPAAWRGPDGQVLLLATSKAGGVVLVHDAATGERVGTLGRPGSGDGELNRPNAIGVWGDVALIMERDNHRVQAFSLPELRPLGVIGASDLLKPYGIAVVPRDADHADIYVTDNADLPIDRQSRGAVLAQRVKRFRLTREGDAVRGALLGAFGDSTGAGVLHVVESIAADPPYGAVLIADEQERDIKIYSLDGRFTGRVFGRPYFMVEPEGMALYACGRNGFWIATDQDERRNVFHIFDRSSLRHIASFTGHATRNTDGVWFIPGDVGRLEGGAFYAVHDDGSVAAFSWKAIVKQTGLRDICLGKTVDGRR